MYPAMTLDELDKQQRLINEKRIVCILLVKPTDRDGQSIMSQFNFLHYATDQYCTIFAPGYSESQQSIEFADTLLVDGKNRNTWYYSDKAFCNCIKELERRLPSWSYNYESTLIVLQSQVDSRSGLSFRNYIAVEIEHGIRQGYIDSFPRFMASLIKAAKREVEVDGIEKRLLKNISIRELLISVIEESKRIPKPAKKIIQQKLFIKASKRTNKAALSSEVAL